MNGTPFHPDEQTPAELRGVSELLDALAAHERAAAPEGFEESIFLSLSLAAAGREAMAAAPADLEDRIFAATRGTLAASTTAEAAADAAPALRLVGEGTLPSDPRLSREAVRRALAPSTAWWRSPGLRAAAVMALLVVPAFAVFVSLRSPSTNTGTAVAKQPAADESATKLALTTTIDAELETLMTVFDDTLPTTATTATAEGSTASNSQTLDDDWFGMAEFLSEDAL